MVYEKLFNEIYAALSLKYLWQEYRPVFVKSESPDWINEGMDLGLEVSQALLPDDGQTEKFIERYLGCRQEDLPEIALQRYGGRLHFYNGRFWAVLPDSSIRQDYISKAQYRFERKLEKLNTNYQHRRYNGLYLFLHPAGENDIDAGRLFEYMRQKQAEKARHFDLIFLNCVEVIYICDYRTDILQPIQLPQNSETFLNTETERLRQSSAWDNGTALDAVGLHA